MHATANATIVRYHGNKQEPKKPSCPVVGARLPYRHKRTHMNREME